MDNLLALGDMAAGLVAETVDGHLVSADIARVVEAIRAYDPTLDVQWIPPAAREPGDAAFRVICTNPNGTQYIVFVVQTEEEFDSRILKRIYQSDQKHGVAKLSDIQATEAAAKELRGRKFRDAMEEANDLAYHIMKSPLHTYKISKELTIKDEGKGIL